MLIPLVDLIRKYGLKISGVLHVGAHKCEEQISYIENGISTNNIYWVEGNIDLVREMKQKNPFVQIFHALIHEKDGDKVEFHITNNGQSSSILDFGTHSHNYPDIVFTHTQICKTTRLDTLIEKENMKKFNFLNLDIQGTELSAIKSLGKYLNNIDYIYTEIFIEEVYKGCCKMKEIDEYLVGFKRVETSMTNQGWGDAFYIRI